MIKVLTLTCPCDHPDPVPAFQYKKPPKGETRFDWKGQRYQRGYRRCQSCGHWSAKIHMDLTNFYRGEYVEGTYGSRLKENFLRVLNLNPKQSDNHARVNRVLDFAQKLWGKGKKPYLLDVGSGLAVFPFRMKQAGWNVTTLDPDEKNFQHAQKAGLNALHGDFTNWPFSQRVKFNAITINKVLEHVEEPQAMIKKARLLLKKQGFMYIEVPDASAFVKGKTREEFSVEHLHVFTVKSLAIYCEKAGFSISTIKQIKEPSGKFTIYSFLKSK